MIFIILCFLSVSVLLSLSPLPSLSERRRYYVARRPSVALCVYVCVCRISLGGEGNMLYPVLSSVFAIARVLKYSSLS